MAAEVAATGAEDATPMLGAEGAAMDAAATAATTAAVAAVASALGWAAAAAAAAAVITITEAIGAGLTACRLGALTATATSL